MVHERGGRTKHSDKNDNDFHREAAIVLKNAHLPFAESLQFVI